MKDDKFTKLGTLRHGLKFDPLVASTLSASRVALNLSQPALAQSLGISHRLYCDYELGTKIPPLAIRMAVRYLLITADDHGRSIAKALLERRLNLTHHG